MNELRKDDRREVSGQAAATHDTATQAMQQHDSRRVMLLLDGVPFSHKPAGSEIGSITRRLEEAGPVTIDYEEFVTSVRCGQTFTCGCFKASPDGWGEFVGQQLFALDFDDPTALGPLEAIARARSVDMQLVCLYFTFGATLEPFYPKYRLVFDHGEIVREEGEAARIIADLLAKFPEADQKCKNINRLFFGSNGEVVELWREAR